MGMGVGVSASRRNFPREDNGYRQLGRESRLRLALELQGKHCVGITSIWTEAVKNVKLCEDHFQLSSNNEPTFQQVSCKGPARV